MNKHRTEEENAIKEMGLATQQLQSAYISVFNKFANISNDSTFRRNPSDLELDNLDAARQRFDKAKAHMDKIAHEIREGIRP